MNTILPNLPALIDRSSARLVAARNSAEVLEAKAIAEAALHYARVTKAARHARGLPAYYHPGGNADGERDRQEAECSRSPQ